MNDERLISLLAAQTAALARMANALEAIALTNAPAPNFIKPLAAYADFDFTSIGALVKTRDPHGPTELEWGGYLWTRRSPQNKFGEAIWFSRCIGKDAEGNNKYARLLTFKKMSEAEPLPRKVEALIEPPAPQAGVMKQSPSSGVTYPVKEERVITTPAPAPASAPSELDAFFGPNPRKADPAPNALAEQWPTNEVEFLAWLKAQSINGKDTRSALGTDAKSWLKTNAGKTYADVAQTIAATLGK